MNKIVTIILISLTFTIFSQELSTTDVEKAQKNIIQLKTDGALVFRVLLKKKNIELYRKSGNVRLANALQKRLNKQNKKMAKALHQSEFNFCPIYLIDSKDYKKVLKKEKSGYFLDENLVVDSSITLNENFFLFVDKSRIYDQVSIDFKHSETTGTPTKQIAFVVMDSLFNQLVSPFPFKVKVDWLPSKKKITSFSLKLTNFYNTTLAKIEKKKNWGKRKSAIKDGEGSYDDY